MSDSAGPTDASNINGQTTAAVRSVEDSSTFVKGHRTRASRSKSAAESRALNDTISGNVDVPVTINEVERDDSEAETVVTSPVKRREALKDAAPSIDEVIKAPGSPQDHKVLPQSSPHAASQIIKSKTSVPETISANTSQVPNNTTDAKIKVEDTIAPTGELVKESAADSKSSSLSPAFIREGSGPGTNGDDTNPRKRKHRDSHSIQKSLQSSTTKRQRRSSTGAESGSEGDSEDIAPSDRSRRHKRLSSLSQAADDDASKTNSSISRVRRAASGLQGQARQPTPSAWESDSDSELSAKPTISKSGRNLARSVSTPGRPVGRDHKRHVNRYGFTRLAEACENGDLDAVKDWRQKDPEQVEQREFAGNTPLQIASLNGFPEIVSYLLQEGADIHCANTDKDTPLIDAVENSHVEVVKVLLDAGVNPLRQNMKGHSALDVITEETDDGPEMRALLRKATEDWAKKSGEASLEENNVSGSRPGPRQGLHFMARTQDNLLKLVANSDREGTQEFLDARVPVDNTIVAAAAKTGDLYLLNMLLAEMSPTKARSKAEKPMLAVLGSSQFEVVKTLTELDQFNPLWRSKANGMTWYQLAEYRNGPHCREERELLLKLYNDVQAHSRLSSSPIQKKDTKRRARSPAMSRGSDLDGDGSESPDHSRKRRLLSRKDLRAATSRRTSPATSPRPTSSPEPGPKSIATADKARRKPGRPRTKSLSIPSTEGQKQTRTKPSRENMALFDTLGNGYSKRKPSVSSTVFRPILGSVKEVKKDMSDSAVQGDDTPMPDATVEGTDRPEEQIKEEDSNLKRQEVEREQKAIEEQRRAEVQEQAEQERILQERLAERAGKVQALPPALRTILELDTLAGKARMEFVAKHFLPIVATAVAAAAGGATDVLHMSTYQAAGLLGGTAAEELLDVPSVSATRPLLFNEIEKHPVDASHRARLQTAIGWRNMLASFDHGSRVGSYGLPDPADGPKSVRSRLLAVQQQFMEMQPLHWIKVEDFLEVKARLSTTEAGEYPHLQGMPSMEVEVVSLRPAFAEAAGPVPPSQTQHQKAQHEAVHADTKTRLGTAHKDGDGRYAAPGPFSFSTKLVWLRQ